MLKMKFYFICMLSFCANFCFSQADQVVNSNNFSKHAIQIESSLFRTVDYLPQLQALSTSSSFFNSISPSLERFEVKRAYHLGVKYYYNFTPEFSLKVGTNSTYNIIDSRFTQERSVCSFWDNDCVPNFDLTLMLGASIGARYSFLRLGRFVGHLESEVSRNYSVEPIYFKRVAGFSNTTQLGFRFKTTMDFEIGANLLATLGKNTFYSYHKNYTVFEQRYGLSGIIYIDF